MRIIFKLAAFASLMAFSIFADAQPLSDAEEFREKATEVVSAYHQNDLFHGVALLALGDEIIFETSFGKADMSWDIAHSPDTRFRIGSITKQFTSALILKLHEEGKIDLDAPIISYLPDYPEAQGTKITINHLLTHRTGIPDYLQLPDWPNQRHNRYEQEAYAELFWALDLEFEPGSRFEYSNSNYFILGLMIEAVTGEAYEDAIEQRLIEPLGLHDTGYVRSDRTVPNLARGYRRRPGRFQPEGYLDLSLPYAGGMLYSTARDLHRWKRALHGGEVFQNTETLDLMLSPLAGEPFGYARGIRLEIRTFGEVSTLVTGHGGAIEAFETDDRYLPEEQLTTIVLSNTGGDVAGIANALLNLAFDNPVSLPKPDLIWVLADMIDANGVDAAADTYRALHAEDDGTYRFSERILNSLGYGYLQNGDVDVAIALFELNVEAYPEAANTYDSLAEAYLRDGKTDQAVAYYEKSLQLNPDNQNATDMLQRISEMR